MDTTCTVRGVDARGKLHLVQTHARRRDVGRTRLRRTSHPKRTSLFRGGAGRTHARRTYDATSRTRGRGSVRFPATRTSTKRTQAQAWRRRAYSQGKARAWCDPSDVVPRDGWNGSVVAADAIHVAWKPSGWDRTVSEVPRPVGPGGIPTTRVPRPWVEILLLSLSLSLSPSHPGSPPMSVGIEDHATLRMPPLPHSVGPCPRCHPKDEGLPKAYETNKEWGSVGSRRPQAPSLSHRPQPVPIPVRSQEW